jgi:hypothetical protein
MAVDFYGNYHHLQPSHLKKKHVMKNISLTF